MLPEFWQYLTVWSVVLTTAVYFLASLWAWSIYRRSSRWWSILIVAVFTSLGAITGLLAGTIMGLALSVLYQAGEFRMTTWIAMLWGLIHTLLLVVSSFSTSTAAL